jgi:predicted ATPase
MSKYIARRGFIRDHYENLTNKIMNKAKRVNIIDEYFNKDSVKKINDFFAKVITGKLEEESGGRFSYLINGKKLKIENLATGLKAFSILKLLFDNGYISSDTLLIIDEPEVHLHPQWQIILAELITLFIRELGANIVLTSHSPYFIEAIDTYSDAYEIKDMTNFYLTLKTNNNTSTFENVNSSLAKVYNLLSYPFDILQKVKLEGQNDNK